MDQIGEGFGEDPLRLFFRTKVTSRGCPRASLPASDRLVFALQQLAAIGTVLETVSGQTKALVEGHGQFSAEEKALLLLETNQVLLVGTAAYTRLGCPVDPPSLCPGRLRCRLAASVSHREALRPRRQSRRSGTVVFPRTSPRRPAVATALDRRRLARPHARPRCRISSCSAVWRRRFARLEGRTAATARSAG